MGPDEAKIRIEQLKALLWENSRRYYVDNAPAISDFEYDSLMHELEALEKAWPEFLTADSPSQRVGSDLDEPVGENAEAFAGSNFTKRAHRYPMLSLSNTYSIGEVEDFALRAEKILEGPFSYCCELKFDGTAICLSYKNGRLVQALTRGDGQKGDDVTQNALQIPSIPHSLKGDYPEELEIRGEILMPYEAFDRLNRLREENEEVPFANPRNAASGSLKLINPEEVARRGLICTLYHIPAQSISFESHDEALSKAASWGLPISDKRKICYNIAQVREFIDYWDNERKFLPYATDGCVIKINELSAQRILGYTAKSPRWAVAYKFQAEKACSKLLSIDYQVGRTGAVTPVANLSPVQLGGTVVRRATLNNADWMDSLDLRLGDYVFVEKGGEVIPKITGIDLSRRHPDALKPDFPSHCPDCGSALEKIEGEARWFCPNQDACPTQIKAKILHFCSRKAMDILAGESTIEQFYSLGLAKCPADLYDINKYQLVSLEGWQEKAAQKFLDSLERTKVVPFDRVLHALGIRHVGQSTAKVLATHFKTIDKLSEASIESLVGLEDIGETIANSIYDYFHNEEHLSEIARLRDKGLQFSIEAQEEAISDVLEGKTIVISGNFSISRDAMKELIVSHGGKAASSISAKTSFLLAGTKAGPEKLKKCAQLAVPIISEKEFLSMLPKSEEQSKEPVYQELTLF